MLTMAKGNDWLGSTVDGYLNSTSLAFISNDNTVEPL